MNGQPAHRIVTPENEVNIINEYNNLTPMITLAKQYGITRQGIYKILRRNGVDTTKRRLPVTCDVCGKQHLRTKCQIRNRTHMFCSPECYYAYLDAGNGKPYIAWRHGGRIARQRISEVFDLQPDHIVHHEDRNQYNNSLDNLRVFACQGDHVRYHRGISITPLWDGSGAS